MFYYGRKLLFFEKGPEEGTGVLMLLSKSLFGLKFLHNDRIVKQTGTRGL